MTAEQRETLERMRDARARRGAHGQGFREIDRKELDALCAALSTPGVTVSTGSEIAVHVEEYVPAPVAAPPADLVGYLDVLRNIAAVARRALSFGHQATPQTPERMIERKDEALRRIHELTGVSGSVLRAAPPVGEAERLREALQRCHRLMEQAVGYVDPEDSPALVDAIHAELRLCDEAGICPGLASPAPQPADPDAEGLKALVFGQNWRKVAAPAPVQPWAEEPMERDALDALTRDRAELYLMVPAPVEPPPAKGKE